MLLGSPYIFVNQWSMAEGEWLDGMVTEECLQELLNFFMKSVYKARTLDRRVSSLWVLGTQN